MKKAAFILALLMALAPSAQSQNGGGIGNGPSTVINNVGRPIAGANVAVCQPLGTTAASVTSNLATFTMASNPQTAGFVVGMTVLVAGFTGADTYLNAGTFSSHVITNGLTILAVSPTTIVAALTHGNASASSNGTILQMGNTTTPCAGLAIVYTDPTLATTAPNPLATDSLGNWQTFGPAGSYYIQFYGPTISPSIWYATVASPNPLPFTLAANQVVYAINASAIQSTPNFTWNPGTQTASLTSTTAATGGANQSSPVLNFVSNYWNGAASAADIFSCQSIPSAGTNPIMNFTCTHSGSSGASFFDFSGAGTLGVKVGELVLVGLGGVNDIIQPAGSSINAVQWFGNNPTGGHQWVQATPGSPIGFSFQSAPWTIAAIDITGQNAAIASPTNLASPFNFANATQYRVTWDAKVTTPAGVSSTLGPLTLNWIDPDGVAQTMTAAAQSSAGTIETTDAGNTTTTKLLGIPVNLNSNNGSNSITYGFGYASNAAGAMVYNLHIRVEALPFP